MFAVLYLRNMNIYIRGFVHSHSTLVINIHNKYHIHEPEHTYLDILRCTLSVNLNALLNNYVKLVITFINLTCITELKINVSWNNTLI